MATAQFPGGGPGGMGGGRQGGDGNGRSQTTAQAPTLNLDGNAPKGNSKIFGFVVDQTISTAVEFANVAL